MCYSQVNSIGDKKANGPQSTRTAESLLAYGGEIKGDGDQQGPQTDLPLDHLCENFVKLTVYVVEIP